GRADHRARRARDARGPVPYRGGVGPGALLTHLPGRRRPHRGLPDTSIKKLAGYDDRYRLRVGDYRIIYEIMDGQLVILVVGVGHRREICRAMS
ncbi:MAG: type II toxin-antitoxin system RelE family toxin, partial [Streptosporangiaceae bacterium]